MGGVGWGGVGGAHLVAVIHEVLLSETPRGDLCRGLQGPGRPLPGRLPQGLRQEPQRLHEGILREPPPGGFGGEKNKYSRAHN